MSCELDAEVAEKLMGYVRHKSGVLLPNDDCLPLWFDHAMEQEAARGELWLRVPPYSADISAAMEVIKNLEKNNMISLTHMANLPSENRWIVSLSTCEPGYIDVRGEALTLPEAICRAALATISTQVSACASPLSQTVE